MTTSETEGSAGGGEGRGESSLYGYIPSYRLYKTSFSSVSMKFSQNILTYHNLTYQSLYMCYKIFTLNYKLSAGIIVINVLN
jgi:hypothetical protein